MNGVVFCRAAGLGAGIYKKPPQTRIGHKP
jgi:hypothetical protein